MSFWKPRKSKFWNEKKRPGDIIPMCTTNENHMMYGSWDMEHDTEFFLILDHFLPFYPTNTPKNQNFEKMKKTPEDIIILLMCTKNHYHLRYCSWDMACDECNFYFSFWAIFCLFSPKIQPKNLNLTSPKI